ncbi:MAG: LPS export ABC transporter permease LptG [Bdellovibrionales bacterium]
MIQTLGRYLSLLYLRNTLFLLCVLLGIIYLFDTVELIRRAAKFDGVPISLVLKMGLLKLPEVGQVLSPFAILFGAMFTFWQLNKRHELVVVRAAGLSVWQLLISVMGVAFAIGVLQVAVINPVGALLIGKFEDLERTFLSRQENQIAVFKEGLWLRQVTQEAHNAQGHNKERQPYLILHAETIKPDWAMRDVEVLFFDADDTFVQRVDAEQAWLEAGFWVLRNGVLHAESGSGQGFDVYEIPTQLTLQDVKESFASPSTLSFWQLPGHIKVLEGTGFDSTQLKVHYQNLIAQPFLFVAMILLAACVSMRPPRMGGGFLLIAVGVFIGFMVFFLSSFLQALGASQQIPVFLAAWSPTLLSFMLGLSVLMNLEDG